MRSKWLNAEKIAMSLQAISWADARGDCWWRRLPLGGRIRATYRVSA